MVIHHIVFSNCIDGIISTAMYLNEKVRSSYYRLYPISKSLYKENILSSVINEMKLINDVDFLVIINLEYHSKCDFWISNKRSDEFGDEIVINKKMIYSPNSGSTSDILSVRMNSLQSLNKPLLSTIEMINKSSYKDVRQMFIDTRPLMLLRAFVEKNNHSEMSISRIVETLAYNDFDMKKSLYQLKISKKIIKDLIKDVKRAMDAMIISQNTSIIRQSRVGKYPKYAEFYINANVKYSVRLSNLPQGKIYFQVVYNKWHSNRNEIDIGKITSSMCGVENHIGYYNTSSGIILEKDSENFLDIVSFNLNKGDPNMEDGMEKYSVDKELDSVESNADSMIKSGEAISIDEAREKAVTKEKEENRE